MNMNQEYKLSMYFAVQKVCNDNKSLWKNIEAFVSAFGDFESNVGRIRNKLGLHESGTTGMTEKKEMAKIAMTAHALLVANAVYAYASRNKDPELRQRVEFSRTDLERQRGTIALERCQLIADEAAVYVDQLGDFGVETGFIEELQEKIRTYRQLHPVIRTGTTEGKNAAGELKALFRTNDRILHEQMDMLAEQFKSSRPLFYQHYTEARVIVSQGSRPNE